MLWGQNFPLTWVGSAWSCCLSKKRPKNIFPDGTPCILRLVHLQAQLGCLLHIRIMATAPPPPPSKSQSNDDCYPEGFGNVFFSTKYVGWLWWWWWQTINTQLQLAPGTKCYLSPKVGAGKPDHVSQVHIPNQFCQLPNIGIGRAIPSFLFHFSCLLFSAATTIVGHFFFCAIRKGEMVRPDQEPYIVSIDLLTHWLMAVVFPEEWLWPLRHI